MDQALSHASVVNALIALLLPELNHSTIILSERESHGMHGQMLLDHSVRNHQIFSLDSNRDWPSLTSTWAHNDLQPVPTAWKRKVGTNPEVSGATLPTGDPTQQIPLNLSEGASIHRHLGMQYPEAKSSMPAPYLVRPDSLNAILPVNLMNVA